LKKTKNKMREKQKLNKDKKQGINGKKSKTVHKYMSHPGFKEQSRVHLIHAPKKTTYIITECIEINVTIIRVLIT
jgi:hypothetical protein